VKVKLGHLCGLERPALKSLKRRAAAMAQGVMLDRFLETATGCLASQPFLGFWSKLFLSAPFQVLRQQVLFLLAVVQCRFQSVQLLQLHEQVLQRHSPNSQMPLMECHENVADCGQLVPEIVSGCHPRFLELDQAVLVWR